MKKRLLIIALCCAITVCMSPMSAFASATGVEYNTDGNGVRTGIKQFTLDPYTYKNVKNATGETNIDISFLKGLVENTDLNMLGNWTNVAEGIFAASDKTAHHYSDAEFDEHFNNPKENTGDLEKCIMDTSNWLGSANKKTVQGSLGDDCVFNTGLSTAGSLKEVKTSMASEISKGINRKISADGVLSQHESGGSVLPNMDSEDNTRPIYNIVTSIEREGKTAKFIYNSFGVAFYDFDLTPIADNDVEYITAAEKYKKSENPIKTASDANEPGVKYLNNTNENKTVSYTENSSKEPVQVGVSFENRSSETLTNSITDTESYEFSQMIGSDTEFSSPLKGIVGGVKETLKLEFTSGEAFSTATTNEKSKTKETANTIDATVVIPAHTKIGIEQAEGTTEVELSYDYPVAISFKTAIFSISGEVYDDNLATQSFSTAGYEHGYFSSIFGGSSTESGYTANENLYKRAVKNTGIGGFDATYGNTKGWWHNNGGSSITKNSVDWGSVGNSDLIKKTALNVPMAATGANMKVAAKSLNSKIYDIEALYSLAEVKQTVGKKEYDMTTGDKMCLDSLEVNGLDSSGVDYYGFDPDAGHWTLKDSSDSDKATVEEDSTTGSNTLTAKKSGSLYLQWNLDDAEKYGVKNSELKKPCIKIDITDKVFDGSVNIGGEYSGVVNDPEENITKHLEATVEDTEGKEVSRPVSWDAKELKGIKITDAGMVSFTEPGTYHVRAAVNDSVKSGWYKITAKEARALDKIEFKAPQFKDDQITLTKNDRSKSFDLSSYLSYFDQYGDKWNGSKPNVDFTVDGPENGAAVNGNIMTVTKEGTYTVHASAAGYSIPDITVTVNDETVVKAAGIDVGTSAKTMKSGQSITLNGKVAPVDTADKTIKWTSSNSKIASVSSEGTVTAVKKGKCSITATTSNGKKAVCTITVISPVTIVKCSPVKSSKIKLTWNKNKDATGYDIYGTQCKTKIKKLKTVKKAGYTVKKVGKSKIKSDRSYKFYVKAYKLINGKKVYISKSNTAHVKMTPSSKYANAKSVKVKKSKLTVKIGKTAKAKASLKITKGKKQMNHAASLKYVSSDPTVAKVDKKGKITGKKAGKCTVYSMALNGKYAKIKVTVK